MYSWNGHEAYVQSHLDPPHVYMKWPQGLRMEPLGPSLMYSWNGHKAYVSRTPLVHAWNGHRAHVLSH